MGWRRLKASSRQQRRGYSDQTSERSRDLVGARVVWEAKMNNWVCDGLEHFEVPCAVLSVIEVTWSRAAAAPVALPLEIDGSRL